MNVRSIQPRGGVVEAQGVPESGGFGKGAGVSRSHSPDGVSRFLRVHRLRGALFVLAALVFSSALFAQTSLEEVSAGLAKRKVVRGSFELERYAAKTARSLRSSGRFTIAADNGIIWFTEKPVKMTQALKKDFMITENARGVRTKSGGNEIYLQISSLTSALFSGDVAAAKSAADHNFLCDERTWTIEIFPKDASVKMALQKIVLDGTYAARASSPNDNFVATSLEMIFVDKNRVSYKLRGHEFFDDLSDLELGFFAE